MTRAPDRYARPTPARDGSSRFCAFEIEIEVTWCRLQKLPDGMRRTACLSPKTGLLALRPVRDEPQAGEIGTYTRAVGLAQFREDAFEVLDRGRGKR